jgi:hypothetical protein
LACLYRGIAEVVISTKKLFPNAREGNKSWAGVHALTVHDYSLGLATDPIGSLDDFDLVSRFGK